jgi:hypothetical protein
MLSLPFAASADWVAFASGPEPVRVSVVSFVNDERGPRFLIDSGGGAAEHSTAEILWVQWREPEDDGETSAGRVAHLKLANGQDFDHVAAESAFVHEGSLLFMIRPAGVPAGEQPRQVDAAAIAKLSLSPLPAEAIATARARAAARDDDDEDAPDFEPDLLDFQYQDPFPKPPKAPPADDFEAFIEQREEQLSGRDPATASADPSNQTAFEAFQFFGAAIGLKSIVLTMIIGFVMGGMMLKFSAASNGISDVPLPRLMACAALLATIPPFLFLLLFWIFPLFYGLKLFTGLVAFYFSARTLVMGFLEVLEGEATQIMVIFYATWVLLLIGLAKIL